jgi:hypothetical protein
VSFTQVIDGNPVLSWLDGLGRLPAEPTADPPGESVAPVSATKTSHHSESGDS